MKKVFRIHGFGGEPNGGWAPWLLSKLAQNGIWACAPQMPTPSDPKKEEWVAEIQRQVGNDTENAILVGHSLGVVAVLRYLESLDVHTQVEGSVLVSGPIHALSAERYRPLDNFFNIPFDFEHIRKVCKNFVVIHGVDDTKVPIKHAHELAEMLSCQLILISKGGHLSSSDGAFELPEALEAVLRLTSA